MTKEKISVSIEDHTASINVLNMTVNKKDKVYFDEVIIPLHLKNFSPPAPEIYVSDSMKAKKLYFITAEPGYIGDWHPAPFPLLIIVLAGTLEIELPGGEKRVISKGEMLFEKDDHKLIHKTSVISKENVYAVVVEFSEDEN